MTQADTMRKPMTGGACPESVPMYNAKHMTGTAGAIPCRYHAKQIHTAKAIEALRVSYVLSPERVPMTKHVVSFAVLHDDRVQRPESVP